MAARITFDTAGEFKAEPAIELGRLKLVCF